MPEDATANPGERKSEPSTLRLTKDETKLLLRLRNYGRGVFVVFVADGRIGLSAPLALELASISQN